MGAWLLKAFSGEQPRISDNLLPPNAAQRAVNVRLDDGALTPLNTPMKVGEIDEPGVMRSIYRDGETWLGWPGYVTAVPGPVASDRLYIMGDGAPKMRIDGEEIPLAVPYPSAPLVGSVAGSPTDTKLAIVSRIYVYTFVTPFGEESEPCAASNTLEWRPGQTITLTGFQAAPAGARAITKQRIYRTQTGSSGTDLYFIAERDASDAAFMDNVADDAFAEVLPSRAYNAPPDDLKGLTAMPNGMMAAFRGKDLFFSQPWLPHAWPEAYVLTCDYEIMALGAIGTSLIIMTKGKPYLAQGTDPATMQMVKMASNLPCVNPYGVVDLGLAIAYPSHEGLVLATADGQAQIATSQLFNRQEWQAFNPLTICAGQHNGRYVASYNSVTPDGKPAVGTLIINAEASGAFLSRSDVRATSFHHSIYEGALYFITISGEVKRFDAPGGAPLNSYWKSKPLMLPAPENFACIRIDTDEALKLQDIANINAARAAVKLANETMIQSPMGSELNGAPIGVYRVAGDPLLPLPPMAKTVTVNVYADGVLKAAVTRAGEIVRLPSGFKARKWEIDVFGSMRVQQIAVASTVTELKAMANT
jgi:hypothetical protein